jgi:hypothetical protein
MAENGLYHVKLEDIKHVIQDQASGIPCASGDRTILYRVLLPIMEYIRTQEPTQAYEDTIHLSATWSSAYLSALRSQVEASEDTWSDLIEPLLEWILAEAGRYFLAGPDCRRLTAFPKFYEEPWTGHELVKELEVVAVKHRDWTIDVARTLSYETARVSKL